jgi:hypothetical protein
VSGRPLTGLRRLRVLVVCLTGGQHFTSRRATKGTGSAPWLQDASVRVGLCQLATAVVWALHLVTQVSLMPQGRQTFAGGLAVQGDLARVGRAREGRAGRDNR